MVRNVNLEDLASNATTTGYLQQLATIGTTDMFSWMGGVTQQQADHAMKEGWRFLQQHHLITFSGHIRSRGRVWAYQNRQHPLAQLLADAEQIPIHSAVLTADNYPETTDPDDSSKRLQQTGITVGYSDGFGRAIQLCALVPEGDAWHREDGGQVDTTPIKASERWGVSGRTEYDNKGQPVRSYQPYFLDSWCGMLKTGEDARREVAKNFIVEAHMAPIETVSENNSVILSFREAGKYTIEALQRDAAAKGHNILEKTIKPSSLSSAYGERANEMEEKAKSAGLIGMVGHWVDIGNGTKEIKGIWVHDTLTHEVTATRCITMPWGAISARS